MPFQLASARRVGSSDRVRLMLFSIAILCLVSFSSAVVTAYQFWIAATNAADRTGTVESQGVILSPTGFESRFSRLPSDVWKRSALLAAAETLALVIAGGTLLVRVCNPFIRRLEESDARIRAIVCTAGDGIITTDQQGTIHSFNRAAERMFQRTEASILGQSIDGLIALPSGISFSKEQLAGQGEEDRNSNERASGRRAHGTQFPLELSLSRVSLGERAIFTVIVRDVTDREAAQERLKAQMLRLQEVKENLEAKATELAKTNRELDDFTYVASHDLKEPLRGIGSYCQILLEDYSDKLDADGQRRLQALVSLCQRLGRLIDDLLTYSQIGRTQPEPVAVDLNEIVADVLETLGPAIDERGAAVHVKRGLPTLSVDRVWVGEVFRNLITNAMKFNDHPRPAVAIGCLDGDTLYVRDNGIGIPECHHEAIFAMFRRLHSRRQYEGTGAGLTFVRKIVEAHGGRVWVKSQPGCGSTFYFTLSPGCTRVHQEPAACAVG